MENCNEINLFCRNEINRPPDYPCVCACAYGVCVGEVVMSARVFVYSCVCEHVCACMHKIQVYDQAFTHPGWTPPPSPPKHSNAL